ncbi:hypothetical protein E2C01_086299 [Portunus trituberculatus]|uniref:Uncharacterized protein n=1 Tax=Portunus trituberculatus TaxID=210409 RepID=A0A5B7J9B1_PORTR|nr:hypothetical protein [Portunus trituberculatus]
MAEREEIYPTSVISPQGKNSPFSREGKFNLGQVWAAATGLPLLEVAALVGVTNMKSLRGHHRDENLQGSPQEVSSSQGHYFTLRHDHSTSTSLSSYLMSNQGYVKDFEIKILLARHGSSYKQLGQDLQFLPVCEGAPSHQVTTEPHCAHAILPPDPFLSKFCLTCILCTHRFTRSVHVKDCLDLDTTGDSGSLLSRCGMKKCPIMTKWEKFPRYRTAGRQNARRACRERISSSSTIPMGKTLRQS